MNIRPSRTSLLAIFAAILLALPLQSAWAVATPTELFISEYVEGSDPGFFGGSTNRAIEIFNPGGAPVDLADGNYRLEIYWDGSTTVSLYLDLSGTVASGDVFVLVYNGSNSTLKAKADATTWSWVMLFNGNDALVLRKDGVVIDSFGQRGNNPGTEWPGGGRNDTLRRKFSVCMGDTIDNDAFNAGTEWDKYSIDTFTGLGSHSTTCGVAPPPPVDWVINEINADPASGSAGDANGDGSRDTYDDEFVEIYNKSGVEKDISGWTFRDSGSIRHTFPAGTKVPADCSIVIFGGGTPTGTFGDSVVQTASSGLVSMQNSGDTARLHDGSSYVASHSYGGEGGDNQSLTRDPDITGSFVKHIGATGSGSARFSPGTKIDGSPFAGCAASPPPPSVPEYKIHEVQGPGATSPLVGTELAIEGIVVGDFQGGGLGFEGDLEGFFVQEEDSDADGNALTSEGIFVSDGATPGVDVATGDKVKVIGTPTENFGKTQIGAVSSVSVVSGGNPLPTLTPVILPVASIADLEPFEGMYVQFPQSLTIIAHHNFDRFGEFNVATDRLFQPTAMFDPGSPAASDLADLNSRSQIRVDDGRATQNPDPAIHPDGADFNMGNLFRGGDLVTDVTGVLDYNFGFYAVEPTQGAVYTPVNLRTTPEEPVGGSLEIATFNVFNYFTTLDDSGPICGPAADQDCRGADNATELTRQRDKIIAAISTIDADVVGLMEIENHVTDNALIDLVAGLNAATAPGTYDFISTGPVGVSVIKVALIYKPASVTPLGAYAILDDSVDPLFNDTYNRPAVAQTFGHDSTGGVFTVVVNHLKSKSPTGPCDAIGDPDLGDGSGECNLTRASAAQAIADWLATDPTGSGDTDFLIIGDLNSFSKEDPIVILTTEGYSDLTALYGGPFAYSYTFDGESGYLDYAMASPNLLSQTTGSTTWHINADEPDLINYDTSFKQAPQDALYAPDAYRSSDHDPVISGFELINYGFLGFFRPIQNPPAVNYFSPGIIIQLPFSLNGDQGMDIFAPGYPLSREISCDFGTPGASEALVAPPRSGILSHTPGTGAYSIAWLTSRAYMGTCRQLVVQLKDGTFRYANFQF